LVAVRVQNAGTDTLYYAHTDYRGSLTALSLPNGTVVERYAYDPWGKRRNPNDWTQNDTRTAFILNRGYTIHEHLPEFNLINMNGRVYDPLTATFFSPDPYLQAPGNWLNYNRVGVCTE
jgi:RHS repeat-associated protein